MKVAKLKKSNEKEQNKKVIKEEYSLKKLLIIILIVLSVFVMFYVITTFVVKPVIRQNINQNTSQLNITETTFSNLLSQSDNEYYVIAIKDSLYNYNGYKKSNYSEIYNKYITTYQKKENALNFYAINMDDVLNRSYYSDILNITNDVKKIMVNDEVLFKIKNKKIENYYVGSSEILKVLSSL